MADWGREVGRTTRDNVGPGFAKAPRRPRLSRGADEVEPLWRAGRGAETDWETARSPSEAGVGGIANTGPGVNFTH